MTVALIVILVVVALVVLYGVVTFNGLIRLRNRADEGFSDIDVQLKRRHDLIPNLVETVKGYAQHEREVFENVTAARSAAVSAQGPEAQARAEGALTGALRQLFAVAEAYPDLKANQNFLELQNEITDTEDKIQAARRFYNMTVRDLNIKVESFPSRILAGMANVGKRPFFELDDPADREVPVVSFGTASGTAPT
jgi:LemA protein